MFSFLRRHRWSVLAACAALVAGGLGITYAVLKAGTGNIRHPDVEFVPEQPVRAPAHLPPRPLMWPNYGYTKAHTRNFRAPAVLRPPFRRLWRQPGHVLLEFPPAIAHATLYQLANFGRLHAWSADSGHLRWTRKLGTLAASSPAISRGTLYVTLLERRKGTGGRVVALFARSGHMRWKRDLPSRVESSPLVDGGRLYFGSNGGNLYALRARDGKLLWRYRANGAIKGSPTLFAGVLYFGDYGGHVHAVRARDGHAVWSTGTHGTLLGAGTFYATAAVGWGRVYIGNTDGRVYSFSRRTGRLAWATRTGNYVYASAALADVPRLGPTAYVGSYDGNLYALNAQTGGVRWRYGMGGNISGSATIVDGVVYFANRGTRDTIGLDVRTGRRVFELADGGYDPVVSDGRRLYVTGYASLYAFEPKSTHHKSASKRHKAHRRKKSSR